MYYNTVIRHFVHRASKPVPPFYKFTAEISESEITFLDTIRCKGDRFQTESRPTTSRRKPSNGTHFTSCLPPGVKRSFIKGEATSLLRTNSSQTIFKECFSNFKLRLKMRGYPNNFVERSLTGVRFEDRRLALQQRKDSNESFAICHDKSPGSTWPKRNQF